MTIQTNSMPEEEELVQIKQDFIIEYDILYKYRGNLLVE